MPQPLSEAARVLGERIRDARLKIGLSQEEIANLASINVSNYGKVERGLSNPTFHTLVRVAAVLGVDPGALITGLTKESLPDVPASFTAADFIREREARRRRG
jgi:transcriptional regulator with XRE-family HTH domain